MFMWKEKSHNFLGESPGHMEWSQGE